MALDRPPKEMMPSFLDRLIDAGTEASFINFGYSMEQIIDSVRTDMEELLNTRQSQGLQDKSFPEVRNSIVTYGLPDFSSIPNLWGVASDSLGKLIEEQIAKFEPRLRNVRAILVDDSSGSSNRRVQFHIEARLCLDRRRKWASRPSWS